MVRPQHMRRTRKAKPNTEPRSAPSCSRLRVVEGAGAMVALDNEDVVVEVVEVGPPPSVTTAVMVVEGRVMIWVITRPTRASVVAMLSREDIRGWDEGQEKDRPFWTSLF